jgi:hypothetical protein
MFCRFCCEYSASGSKCRANNRMWAIGELWNRERQLKAMLVEI